MKLSLKLYVSTFAALMMTMSPISYATEAVYGLCGATAPKIKLAVQAGYKVFDSAKAYHHGGPVNQFLKEALEENGVERKDVFIIDKIDAGVKDFAGTMEDVLPYVDKSLDLFAGYMDCFMFHDPYLIQPAFLSYFVDLHKEGKIKEFGFSNVTKTQYQIATYFIEEVLKEKLNFTPSVEVEGNIVYFDLELTNYVQSLGGEVYTYRPLGAKKRERILDNPIINTIALDHNWSPTTVILSWEISKGVKPITSSGSLEHMKENRRAGECKLSQHEIAAIDQILAGNRLNNEPQLTGWQDFTMKSGLKTPMRIAGETFMEEMANSSNFKIWAKQQDLKSKSKL